MTSPIDILFDEIECKTCGETWPCSCYVMLVCESCGATKYDERIPEYGDAEFIECSCPDCRIEENE